jgi:hypothetical protein
MATYKEIKGFNIKTLSADPSNLLEGDIWYNTTSNTLKVAPLVASAWSAANTLNIARDNMGAAKHCTSTAGLVFGGHTSPPISPVEGDRDVTESYNGTAWTSVNVLNTIVHANGGAGTLTAALSFAGQGGGPGGPTTQTENWDGTNWTVVNTMNTARTLMQASAGTQGAALAIGGNPGYLTITEEYDGTNWSTSPGSMNTPRGNIAGTGTLTAALAFGGTQPGTFVNDYTESYDGSTWTTKNVMNTARRRAAGGGTLTAALGFGGLVPGPAATTSTETFDGTSWSTASSMGTGRYFLGGFGLASTDSMAIGGLLTGVASDFTNLTEEYNPPGAAVKTVTTS